MDAEQRVELAYQLRKLAEAWWKLADAVEDHDGTVGAKLVALAGITDQAVNAALGMVGRVDPGHG